MKKLRLAISIFIIAVLLTSSIFAEGGQTLDVEQVASQIILHSTVLKATAGAYDMSDKQDANANKGAREISQMARYPLSENSALAVIRALEVTPLYTKYRKDAMLIQVETLENTIRLQAYEQYINLLKIDYALNIQDQLVKSLQNSFKQAEKKFKSGQISKLDYRAAEINLQKAKLEYQRYSRNKASLIMMLNQAMGKPLNTTYEGLTDSNIMPDSDLKEFDQYLNSALSNRGEVRNNEQYLEVLKKDYEIGKVSHPFEKDIYHSEYQYKIEEASYNVDIQKLNVQLEIMSAYKELEKKYLGMKSAEKSLELANAELRALTNMYKQGQLSDLDYMNVNIKNSQSKIQTRNTQLDLWLYQRKLESAVGVGPALAKK